MTPRKRGGRARRGGAASTRGRGQNKKTRKDSSSEDEAPVSDIDDDQNFFDKNKLQTVKYDFEELLKDPYFNHPELVGQIDPKDLTKEYYEKTGLETPLLFHCDPRLLGMEVPTLDFSVLDVLDLVGGNRVIEVVQVNDQSSVKMSLEEFIKFYTTPAEERKTLYNVLSLEFSQTKLQDLVKSPSLVREIDWVGNKWPDALRQRWINFKDKKHYTPNHTFPKVQNYCLMSVGKCYTDFHIDFSGTSVWYHVLKGKKVFWLIPPTETNFMLYQEFIQTPENLQFFGKSVEICHMAVLNQGDTMLIPSGWIHAVYTPEDSLVFGGNFLHSLSCKMQIRVYQCENRLNITKKFRLPYNEELIFYVIADYVKKWTGREYVRPMRIQDARLDYCGDLWMKNGGHRKPIEYKDYENGVHLDNEDETNEAANEVKVIAMHAENSIYSTITTENVFESEGKEEEIDLDELIENNPLIFYKHARNDFVRNKSVPDHKLPVGDEPPIVIREEAVADMTPRLVEELDALVTYIKKKGKVEISEGICQPASLLACAAYVINKKKIELGLMVEEERRVIETRKRKRMSMDTESASVTPSPVKQIKKEEKKEIDDDIPSDFPDNFLEDDECPKLERFDVEIDVKEMQSAAGFEIERDSEDEEEVVHTPEKSSRAQRHERYEARKEDEIAEVEKEKTNDVDAPTAPANEAVEDSPVADSKASKKKSKEETAEEKERKKLELKRMKQERRDAEKRRKADESKAKHKKKSVEKAPQYVGGMPMNIMPTEALPSPYNYDPLMEMTKLGQGQLKSAYRKSKANISAPKVKKIYKIDGVKTISIDDGEHEPSTSSPHDRHDLHSPAIESTATNSGEIKSPTQPLNVDVFEFGRIPKKKRPEATDAPITPNQERKASWDSSRKASLTSPSIRPRSESTNTKPRPHINTEKRRSGEAPKRRSTTYMPAISRQDRLITDGMPLEPIVNKNKQHQPSSLISPKPALSRTSTDSPYTPSAPKISSWIPAVEKKPSTTSVGSDSPIDVVELQSPPPSSQMSRQLQNNTSPLSLNTSFDSGRPDNMGPSSYGSSRSETNGRSFDKSPAPKAPRIPTDEAIAQLKRLTGCLKDVSRKH